MSIEEVSEKVFEVKSDYATPGMADLTGYDPLDGIALDEDELGVAEVQGSPEPDKAPEPPQRQQQPAPQPQQQINGNVYARARILERERDVYRDRFEKLWQAVAQVQAQSQQSSNEQSIDESELDPTEVLKLQNKKILSEIEAFKTERSEDRQNREIEQEFDLAKRQIQEFSANSGGLYGHAVAHLAAVELAEFLEENPDVTPAEAEAELTRDLKDNILKWHRSGKNPAEELFKKSFRRGFQIPNQVQQSQSAQQKQQKSQNKEKEEANQEEFTREVRRAKRREVATRTLASVPGASGGKQVTPETLLSMPEDEFTNKIAEMSKNLGKSKITPKFSDLLSGRGRRSSNV